VIHDTRQIGSVPDWPEDGQTNVFRAELVGKLLDSLRSFRIGNRRIYTLADHLAVDPRQQHLRYIAP